MEYVRRELAGTLKRALEVVPVVVLTGMRQVGKSTVLVNEEAFYSRPYFTLDDYANMRAARENPAAFLGTAEGMTIREAKRIRETFLAAKGRRTENAGRPVPQRPSFSRLDSMCASMPSAACAASVSRRITPPVTSAQSSVSSLTRFGPPVTVGTGLT